MKRGRPFEKGNKFGKGRPRGSRNKKTLVLQAILEEYMPALLKKAVAMALQGDSAVIRLLLDHKLPRASGSPVKIGRLPAGNIQEVGRSHQKIIDKVASGDITPAEALQVDSLLETSRKVIETDDIAKRLDAFERIPETNGHGRSVPKAEVMDERAG